MTAWRLERRLDADARSAAIARIAGAVLAFVVAGIILWFTGRNPLRIFWDGLDAVIGGRSGIEGTTLRAVPILMTAVAVALSLRMKIWNIGADGQFLVGALAALGVGIHVDGPGWLVLLVMAVVAALAGALWILVPALARAYADGGAACLRINPGNIGSSKKVAEVVRAAKANGCAIRIGVNAGSLEKDLLEKYGEPCPEALIESALDHIKLLQDHDFHEFKVAVKASDVFLAVAAYHGLADAVDCPLHLGITEAGGLIGGTVKSSIGMGSLLWAGIGDTIRVSLSAEPEEEVKVGYGMLKALGLRTRGVRVVSCPSCSRQGFDVIRTVEALEKRLEHIKTPMSLSVLGCVVNGPGEARETDVGLTGGGNGKHMVYLSGVKAHTVDDEDTLDHIVRLVEEKAAKIEAGEAVAFDPHAEPAEAAE